MHSTGFIIQEDYHANPLFDEMEHHHANCEEKHFIVNSLTVDGSKTTEEPQVQLKATQFRPILPKGSPIRAANFGFFDTGTRARKSVAWKFFRFHRSVDGRVDRKRARCLMCIYSVALNRHCSTTAMLTHLRREHSDVAKREGLMLGEPNNSSGETSSTSGGPLPSMVPLVYKHSYLSASLFADLSPLPTLDELHRRCVSLNFFEIQNISKECH